MAVYKRYYKPYEGRLTANWSLFLVPARYALERLFQSRILIAFLVVCYIFPIFAALAIYLNHNLSAIAALGLRQNDLLPIDNEFFAIFLSVQGIFSFLLTAYAAPGLIAPDLSNNALPLYLCRPISRWEYVLGKMAVLFIPLSFITWIPGLLLWGIQAGLDDSGWAGKNLNLAWGVVVGALIWIIILSLLGLALSAWVRWRIAASALLFGTFFISAAFSEVLNEVLVTKLGYLFNMGHLIGTIWARILQVRPRQTFLGEMFNIRRGDEIPMWAAWLMVAAICGVCVLLLNKKLRGKEVVS
jgi:ABC-2 type transport system permease protein